MARTSILDTAVNGRAKRPRVRIRAARVSLLSRELMRGAMGGARPVRDGELVRDGAMASACAMASSCADRVD
jgi:hypothetical protein